MARKCGNVTIVVKTWVVQGNYGFGHGWEDLTGETSKSEILARLHEYRENEPGVSFRIRSYPAKIVPSE